MDGKRKIKLVWALAGALILIHGSPARAQDDSDRQERRERFNARMEERIQRMHSELGLSSEQQRKLKAHRESKMQRHRAYREKIRAQRQALRAELQKPDIDRQRVNALHNEIKHLMNQSADDRLEGILEVREILTPEQYRAFMKKKEEFKGRRGQWREKRFRGDRPERIREGFRNKGPDESGPEF